MKKKKSIKSPYREQRKKKSGRLCRVCGKDAHPNFFFCPSCHHRVSQRVDSQSEVDEAVAG